MLREILRVSSVIEIAVLFLLFYTILRFIRGTQGAAILKGFLFLFAVLFIGVMIITEIFKLYHIKQMLQWILSISVIVIIIIFAPEIRRGLLKLAQYKFFSAIFKGQPSKFINEIAIASANLSTKRVGGLIAIEREIGLSEYVENAVRLDASVSSELIETIFYPGSPLHDGAIIIKGDRVIAAGCLFPLTEKPNLLASLGTRHRAAIGITELTDAVTVIISEETGKISLCSKGCLTTDLDRKSLENLLQKTFLIGKGRTDINEKSTTNNGKIIEQKAKDAR